MKIELRNLKYTILIYIFFCFYLTEGIKNEIFEEYVETTRKYMNPKINPCENFDAYACENVPFGKREDYMMLRYDPIHLYVETDDLPPFQNIEKYIQDIQKYDIFVSEGEKQLLRYYESCKNKDYTTLLISDDFTKIFNGWPVLNENWNADKQMTWNVILNRAHKKLFEILEIDISNFTEHEYIYASRNVYKNRLTAVKVEEIFLKLKLNASQYKEEIFDIVEFEKDIVPILKRLEKKYAYTHQRDDLLRDTGFGLFFPDYVMHKNVTEEDPINSFLRKVFLNRRSLETSKNALKDLVDYLSITEPHVLVNYVMVKFVQKLDEEFCPIHRIPDEVLAKLISRLWTDRNKVMNVLNIFLESNYQAIDADEGAHEMSSWNYLLRFYVDNLNKFLDDQAVNNAWENVTITKKSFLENYLNLLHLKSKKNTDAYRTSQIVKLLYKYDGLPSAAHFAFIGFRVWTNLFSSLNTNWSNKLKNWYTYNNLMTDCLKPKLEGIRSWDDRISKMSLALHLSFHDYNKWIERNQLNSNQEDEILKNYGLNNRKLYLVSLRQNFCRKYNYPKADLMRYEFFENYLQNLVFDEYNCPKEKLLECSNIFNRIFDNN